MRRRTTPSAIAAACALLTWAAVGVGAAGIAAKERVLSAFVPGMHGITGVIAAALAALGVALWVARASGRSRTVVRLGAAGLAVVLLLAALAEYVSGDRLGSGAFFETAPSTLSGPASPQGIAAALLLCVSFAILRRAPRVAQGFALAAMVIAAAAAVSIAFGVPTLLGVHGVPGASLPAAIAVAALASGVIAVTTEAGVGRLLVAQTRGGKLARRGLVIALGASIGLAVIVFMLDDTFDLLSPDVAASLYLLGSMIIAAGLVLRLAFTLDRVDQARAATLQELVASESRARELIEHAPEAIVVLDVGLGRFVRVNPEAERLFGLSAQELLTRGPLDLSAPVQADGRPSASVFAGHVEEALSGEVPFFEWLIRTSSGRTVESEIRLLRLPDPARRLVRGSIVDVGSRKQAEAALRAVEVERAARAAAESDRDRIAALQRITAQLLAAPSVDDVATAFVRRIVPDLGATTGLIYTISGETLVRRGHTDDAGDVEWSAVDLGAPTTSAAAARSGAPVVIAEASAAAEFPLLDAAMAELGYAAFASLPLYAGDELVGVASFGYADAPQDEHWAFLGRVAERVGQALERARLFEAEQAARRELEYAAERAAAMQRVTQALARASTPDEVVELTATLGIDALGASASTAGILDEEAGTFIVRTYGFPIEREPWFSTLATERDLPGPLSVRTGEPLWFESADAVVSAFPETLDFMERSGFGAMACVPLMAWGRPLGFLAAHYPDDRPFSDVDRVVFTTLASVSAQALERALRFQAEHETASVLQQSMLPSRLPRVPNLSIAARYSSAGALDVGGDWYDALALDDGSVVVSVGDVVGRGLDAATAMGQLRSAINALALAEPDPCDVLDTLDRYASSIDGARLATVAIARIDPSGGSLVYASAGHVPAVLVLPDGAASLIEPQTSFPLDARPDAERDDARCPFPAGSTLVLYSDGLIERRGESLELGLGRLERIASELHDVDVEGMCDAIMDALLPDGGQRDDVALLCVRREPIAALLRRIPADPEELAPLRRELAAWLADAGLSPDRAADLVLAVDEACANAVEHAYGFDRQRQVTVEVARPGEHEVIARVSDSGHWLDHEQDGHRGRGLNIIRAMVDDCRIESDGNGTTVLLTQRIGDHAVS
jgi:PAS domain S-box-containing protein